MNPLRWWRWWSSHPYWEHCCYIKTLMVSEPPLSAEHKVKDYGIIQDILCELQSLLEVSSYTLFERFMALWQATPWRGGWTGSESSQQRERRWRHSVSRWPKPEGGFHWVDDACKTKSYTRCPTVKKCNKAHKEKMAWRIRSRKTHTEEFLERPNTARPQLGVALLRRSI